MKKKVGIFGAGGFIGSELQIYLRNNYDIIPLAGSSLYEKPELLSEKIKDIDIIINVAGYPVKGRWTKSRKNKIYTSRVEATRNLIKAINLNPGKLEHFISASAVGIYDDKDIYDEAHANYGNDFLATVVMDWEKEIVTNSITDYTILRIGVVLSTKGGAYKSMRNTFKLGLGGIIGSGKQGFSYILIEDLVKIFEFVISEKLNGIINAVSPEPVDNKTFTKELSQILGIRTILRIPAIILKFMFGEGSSILLNGQKVMPSRLMKSGFKFVGNNLKTCLEILEK